MKIKDVVLTEEMKVKLKNAGALGIQIDSNFFYVPEIYREKNKDNEFIIPKECWPVFTLRGLNGIESTKLEDEMTGGIVYTEDSKPSINIQSGHIKIEICRRGIIAWKNFYDIKGNEIPKPEKDVSTGGVTTMSLKYISPKLLTELSNAITEQSYLTEEELLGLE